jgi:FdhD protein
MVEKTASFGVATLVAVSAPTSLAIERAEALGITLYAIARADGAIQFTGQMPDLILEKCA